MKIIPTRKNLVYYSLFIPPIMIILFAFFSNYFGKTIGYFVPYAIYLMILLLGSIFFMPEKKHKFKARTNYRFFYYIVAFIPVIATFFVAFLPTLPYIRLNLLLLLIVFSLLNGILEENFWRVTFNKVFGNNIILSYFVPTIIFSLWHFALLFASDVNYHGGALALVGGASVMGAIWGIVMFKTKNPKVIMSAHVLTNFFAFSQLLYQNWFI